MFAMHSGSEMRVGGALLLAVSLGFLYGTIRHFDWMKRKVPFLLRWGRGGFPASRFGCVAASVVGIAIGSMCFDRSFEILSRSVWGILFGVAFAAVAVAAMYDFWVWRRGRQRHIEPREPIDVEMSYTPNHISVGERILHVVLSLGLISYGLIGFLKDDLYMPAKRGGFHLHGASALLMFMAMLSASAVLLSVVVDHYDKRNNERYYYLFARLGEVAGWTFFGLALALDLYLHVTR